MTTKIVSEDDIKLVCASNKTIELDKVVWDDQQIVPGDLSFAGDNDPTLSDWQPGASGATFKVYKFQKDDEAFAVAQFSHSYKQGEDVICHLHWSSGDRGGAEGTALVGWKVDYSWSNTSGVFPSSSTADLSDACSGVDDTHEITSGVTMTGTSKNISSMLVLRIYRSDTGADDTWAGVTAAQSPILLEFDIHYPIDTLGSRQEFIK